MSNLDECYEWWKGLSEDLQYRIMLNWFPYGIKEDTDVDKFFGDLPDDKQLWIYERETKENKNEVELSEKEKADIVGDKEAHRIMVEGREIE